MTDSGSLWPLVWWASLVIAGLMLLFTWLVSLVSLRARNNQLNSLAQLLRDAGLDYNLGVSSVEDDKSALLFDASRLVVLDLTSARVVQSVAVGETTGIKIYEDGSDAIAFRVILMSGAQSRKLMTRSVVDFARLFTFMMGAGKRIEYIQE